MRYYRTMLGLGDNLYTRAIVRHLAPCMLMTPWPQVYADIPGVTFTWPARGLRTQDKNVAASTHLFQPAPPGAQFREIRYQPGQPMLDSLARSAGLRDGVMLDMAWAGGRPERGSHVLVRPVTVRSEWMNEARNPLPQYIATAAAATKRHVISVADLEQGREWLVGEAPHADEQHHAGLPIEELLRLTASAAAMIGGVGWIVPAAMVFDVPLLCVLGGQLGHNAPRILTDTRVSHRITFAVPANSCRCTNMRHNCEKQIPNFGATLADFCAAHLNGPAVVRRSGLRPVTAG